MISSRRREKEREREERRKKRMESEDAAGKLLSKAPDLTSLSIAMHETRPEGVVSDTYHIRRFVVEHAPALFEVSCSDPRCEDGGYDITREILLGLAGHQKTFEGAQDCGGHCGTLSCGRCLKYTATASYKG